MDIELVKQAYKLGYRAGFQKSALKNDSTARERWKNRAVNAAALSSATLPFLVAIPFKRRAPKLVARIERILHNPNARKISLRDAAMEALREKSRWDVAGYKFNPMTIAEQNVPGFADLSRFVYDPSLGTGQIRIGVKNIADAHVRGINSDAFFHELGHAHEAYNTHSNSVLGSILRRIGSKVLPLRWNPRYKEELRAWNNAKKLSGGKIDQSAMDAALATYRNDIYKNNAMALTGAGSTALIGSRFLGNNNN